MRRSPFRLVLLIALAAVLPLLITGLPRAASSTHGQAPPYGSSDAPAPGSAVVSALGGSVSFERDYAPPGAPRPTPTAPPGALSRVTVTNEGPSDVSVDAAITDNQRFTLTLTVDARLSLVPLAPDDPQTPQQCSPARGSRIVCPVQGSLTTGQATLAVTAIYPQQHLPMPQSMTLAGNAAATFTSPDDAAVLAVQRLSAATPLQLSWDGSTLTATAPPGFGVRAQYHPERCLPAAAANVVNCAATGTPPQLLQLVVFDTRAITTRAIVPPGQTSAPAGGEVIAVWPNEAGDTGAHRTITLANAGDAPIDVRIDDSAATLTAPPGAIVLPSIACTPTDDSLRTTVCPLAGVDRFTALTAPVAAAQPLPQQVDVAPNAAAALIAPVPGGAPIAVGIVNRVQGFFGPATTAVTASWDGATLTLHVPDDFALKLDEGGDGCTALDAVPSAFACDSSGAPPSLVVVSTASTTPSHFPPGTPPVDFAQITSPTPTESFHVRQPVTFAADGGTSAAYVWDFGDGTAATGAVVQHSYATAGLYQARLFVYGPDSSSQQSINVAVDVAPVAVSYPAGWNLIGLPFGTPLTGTQGPLYGWTFPPCGAVPPPPDGRPCTDSYQPLPAGQPLAPNQGYWAYFPQPTTITLPFVQGSLGGLETGAGEYILVGNANTVPVTVTGADVVYTYDPSTHGYHATDTLQPGQGGWAYTSTYTVVQFVPVAAPPAPCTTAATAPAPPAWQQQCPPVSPPPTAFAAATYDAATSSVLLFGGGTVSPDTRSDATWTWDGATWTQQQPAHSPAARTFPALAYDGASGDAVLFGGADPSTPFLGDTWTWDGSDWTPHDQPDGPAPRYGAGMAFDAAHGVVVMAGGYGRQGMLADTWLWDGDRWTAACGTDDTPACGTVPNADGAMTYDATHGQIVMFGGTNGDNDTWLWDGSEWSFVQPAGSPPPGNGQMVFDAQAGRVLLLLPRAASSPSRQATAVWAWDGSAWQDVSVAPSPSARFEFVAAFDALHGVTVLFGRASPASAGSETTLADTWTLRAASSP